MARTANPELEANRKAEILSAASRAFVAHGLHGASMRQICAEATLSTGTVYHYFSSKEAIIEGIADNEKTEIAEISAYLEGQKDAFKAVVQVARWIIEETSAAEVQMALEMAAEAGRNPQIRALVERNSALLHTCLSAAVKRGQAARQISRAQKPEALTHCVTALYEGFLGQLVAADKKQRKLLAKLTETATAKLLTP
jgi:TetR/AcrR family transcriptional regulator, repressor for uid operon